MAEDEREPGLRAPPGLPGACCARREPRWFATPQRGSSEALEELFRRHWRRPSRCLPRRRRPERRRGHRPGVVPGRDPALDRFDRGRPFGPWLHRITVNRAIDHARARALRRESALSPAAEPAAPDPDAISDQILAALAGLPPEHRAVVVLRYVLEYTPGEIADARTPARDRELAPAARPRPAPARGRGGRAMTRGPDPAARLRDVRVPGRGGGRAALVGDRADRLRGAHAGPAGPPSSPLALALGGGLAALAIVLSPAGAKVGDLVSDVVGIGEEDAKPALRSPPAAGELWSSPSRGHGSCARTARSGCSATTRRRAGRSRAALRRGDGRANAARGRARRDGAMDDHRARAGARPALGAEWRPRRLSLGRGPLGGQRRRQRSATDRPQRRTDSAATATRTRRPKSPARRLSTSLPTSTDEARSGC